MARFLVQFGLLRPERAGDPSSSRIVFDPLFAYLRAAAGRRPTVHELIDGAKTGTTPALPGGAPAPKA